MMNPNFWAKDQPDNYEKNCLALDGYQDYFLDKKSCFYENHFICEYEASQEIKNDDDWFLIENFYVKYFINELKSWTEARLTCEQHNAHLLTLNDNYSKLSYIQAYLKTIKLNDDEKYFWV